MRTSAVCCVLASLFAIGCATGTANVPAGEPRPVPWPPESLADHWSVGHDEQGRLRATCDWQYGTVDRRLTILMHEPPSGPARGDVRYPNDHRRTMNPKELEYFWNFGGAQRAVERWRTENAAP